MGLIRTPRKTDYRKFKLLPGARSVNGYERWRSVIFMGGRIVIVIGTIGVG